MRGGPSRPGPAPAVSRTRATVVESTPVTEAVSDRRVPAPARITGVGTRVPDTSYTQAELLEVLGIDDPPVRSLFLNSAIRQRHLCLPPERPDGRRPAESQADLLRKHASVGLEIGRSAIVACLAEAGATASDVRHLCCVSSTGFITPGFTALLIKDLDIGPACSRLDAVGMGCNGGLNALAHVSAWARCHPGQLAIMACIEVCSAAYVVDGTMRTSVVNSLFGDGAAAMSVMSGGSDTAGPELLAFASQLIPEAIDAMRYDWDDDQGRFSFFLAPDIPYVIGAHVADPVDRLLASAGLRRRDIDHWVLHSGGKKVIDAVRVNLGLTRHDVRHTTAVLRDFGNLSSGAFMFSYQRLLKERAVARGDHGVLVAMGPGSTIETALLRWP